jgi:hypothetical protein
MESSLRTAIAGFVLNIIVFSSVPVALARKKIWPQRLKRGTGVRRE